MKIPDLNLKGPIRRINVNITSISDYVRIFNGIFSLTDMEIAVVSELIRRVKLDIPAFIPPAKESIADMLEVKSIDHYLRKLKSKGALLKEGSQYTINPMIMPGKHRHILFDLDLDE